MNKYLKTLYLNENSPTYLSGINPLYREAKNKFPKIKVNDVVEFLSSVNVYTLHKPNKKYKSSKTISPGLDCDWQIDLADMQKYRNENKGYGYILTCIDVLSKYGWAVPLKNKTSENVISAFSQILKDKRKPWRIYSDKGKEFVNTQFQSFMKENNIKHITAENPDTKAAVAERYNRTLKTRIFKHFTHKNSRKWLGILPKIVSNINRSINRMHEMRPIDITHKNDQKVFEKLYKSNNKHYKIKFKVGDLVRITNERLTFRKGYLPTRTTEIFIISNVIKRKPPVYKLKDLKNEDISGIFYTEELVKVKTPN